MSATAKKTKPATADKKEAKNSVTTDKQEDSTSATVDNGYYNEYAKGVGYLNSFKPSFNNEGYVVKVAVLQGRAGDMRYEPHELIVGSATAVDILTEYQESIDNEDVKVLIRFNMINPQARAFIHKSGNRKGLPGAVIGGVLTRIMLVKVDGKQVYKDERTFDESQETAQSEKA